MAKNKKKTGKVINFQPISLENYIKSHARKLPILECFQTENINGLSQVKVVRKKANGKLIVGFYLIDMYCFGLKDTFYREFEDYEDYESQALNIFSDEAVGQTKIEADYAFNLVYGAIEYAEDNGFKIPKEFKVSEYILDDVEDIEFIDIEFGLNGKPVFIPGPYDNVQKVLNTLNTHVGKGNYMHFADVDDFDEDYDEYDEDYERIGELSAEEFNDELIKNTTSFKNENASYFYSLFVYISLKINDLYEEDLDELDELLKTDREGIKAKIKAELTDNMFENDSEDFDYCINLSLENMINNQGVDYLLYKDFKEALEVFSESKEPKEHIASFLNYFTTIKQKRNVTIINLLATLSEHWYKTRNLDELSHKQQSTLHKAALGVFDGDYKNLPSELIDIMTNLIDEFDYYTEYYPFKSQDDKEAYILELLQS